MAVPSVEERLAAERARMRPSVDSLRDRVETHARGPRSREILLEVLQTESLGHLDFALFTCPPVIDRGEGARLWDVDGNEYIDCHAGFTVAALGHANAEVNAAIADQLGRVMQYAELPFAARAELSRRMAAKHPGSFEKRVFYAVTGGEAIEIAIKLARWYTGKPFILTHFGDYHGRTAGAMALTSKASMVAYNWPIPAADQAVIRLPFAYCYRCPYARKYPECELHCASEVGRLFENKEAPLRNPKANVTNVAAFVIEPFQASAGYIIPPMEYLTRLAEIAATYEVLFVSDEVQCGMGRSGRMWAIEHAGVEPDLITIAKCMSNGLPMSMVTGRAEILDSMGPGGHSTTFAGYPAAAAGANKVLDIYERDDIPGRAASNGAYFLDGLLAIQAAHPSVGEVQGKGLFLALELVRDRTTKVPADAETSWAHQECVNQGLICISSGYFYNRLCLAPPLIIDRPEIDRALQILDRVIGDMERKFLIAG